MSVTIPHPETGEPTELFVRINEDGYVDALCRAASKSAWDAAAAANGLTVDGLPIPGASIDVIGSVITSPAVLDSEGNEVTPATIDNRYHVNLRLAPDRAWFPIAYNWMRYGNDDAQANNAEGTRTLARVSLIDPDSINTPSRVWL